MVFNAEDYAKPPHLTKKEVLEVKQAFDIFDNDGSGVIDPQELREAFVASGIKTYHNKFIYQDLGELDTDNSGVIDFEELLHLVTAKVRDKDTREQIQKVLNLYDWNKEDDQFNKLKVESLGMNSKEQLKIWEKK
ncbi:unnamed protein product [Paramecium octaurelia]|uniref:EF-hand domain-containing protein n=1 Tax=Paramecium octaurelia TaxID=43137 RepID=A0A8S1UJI5_PAROT|nr:unnamed protein product [Paramecium octaurelia]